MYANPLSALLSIAALAVTLATPPPAAQADDAAPTVSILVLKEHGVGSPALAQPYLNRFVDLAGQKNQWASQKGVYFTGRVAAEAFIESQKPQYGILSLGAFLALKEKYHYDVVGQVAVTLVGGRQYYLISKTATDVAGCKGKTLASDHTDDSRFIEKVVFGGAFKLSDFQLVQTQRPLQTITKVLSGDAVCALVDDAQIAELSHLDGSASIHRVWQSEELPPMAVVAFPNASKAARQRFKDSLPALCRDEARNVCAEVGIIDLIATGDTAYAGVMQAYAK